ncbi:hypothetical protein ACQVP2_35355, partial [Methylobacterium aquaticum]
KGPGPTELVQGRPATVAPAPVPPVVQPAATPTQGPAVPPAPARPASLTPPAAPVRPEPTAQPDATIRPVPTIQPQPTNQPAPAAPQPQPQQAAQPAPVPGEAAIRAAAEVQHRIGLLERALAAGSQANVRIPETGIVTSRRSVEDEIAGLRRRVEAQRPVPAAPAPERTATVAPAPAPAPAAAPLPAPRTGAGPGGPTAQAGTTTLKVDPQPALDGMRAAEEGARRLQTTMGQDLSGPARESMQSYTAALKAGTAEAVAAVTAAVAQMKAMLNFTASPTIAPRLVAPSGTGAAPAGGAPATKAAASTGAAPAGPSGPAPRVQSASLRRSGGGGGGGGGGGVTITGPVHVHGVKDVAGMHRQISRIADRRARDARDGALHDTGVESA